MALFGYGGIEPPAHDAVFGELITPENADIQWAHRVVYDDALIDRSRSVTVARAMRSNADVIVMVDHDIQWAPGDLGALAKQAKKANAIVGGLYACRSLKRGFSSRLEAQGVSWNPGGETLHRAEYVATGFMAIPTNALRRIIVCCERPDAPPEMRVTECVGVDKPEHTFWDVFRPMAVPCTMEGFQDKSEYLSEDWAFCARAKFAEVPLYIWERPVLRHWGKHGFTVDDGLREAKPK